jgi:hypothetical protein
VAFSVENIDAPVSYMNGTFTVAFDPETIPYVNDAVPTATMVETAAIGFGPVWSRVDYFPFGVPDPGILIGYASGGFDNKTIALINVYDYRVRFIIDEQFNLLSARGAVKLFNGPVVGFDTSQGIGTVALWSVLIDGQPPVPNGAIPEPATWGLMIAGFGLIGAAARRRSRMPGAGRHVACVHG